MPRLLATLLLVLSACAPAPAPSADEAAAPALAPDTSWVTRSALYEVFVRDFSPEGTLAGVTAGLDRIAATGADVIWLMPIYPIGVAERKGTLGSPYAARDYYAIDPAQGTPDDLRALVEAAHARGMKVILDWVPNHTAADARWVTEHPDFYVRDEAGRPSVPRNEQGQLTDWTDVVQLDYGNPALREAMIAAMTHWLREYGLDGFRVDVAGFVPDDFWREATPALRAAAARPILLLAEWGDLRMHQLGFDLTYAWGTYSRLKDVWQGAPASGFVASELADLLDMPPGGMRLRFTTNHDETAWDDPPVAIFGGSAGARAAFVASALLPGRPLLYNGQEVESPQTLRLFERDPVAWDPPGGDAARAFYRRVIDLARTHPALLAGGMAAAETSAPADVIAYRRGPLLVLVNPRSRPVTVTVPGVTVEGARDLLTDRTMTGREVRLPTHGALVLEPVGTPGS